MSSLTNNAPFSLNAINLRKELVFPDGTIQTTAYTGAVGGSTLEEVLDAGNNANGIGIVELPFIHINDGDDSSVITQSGIILAIQSGGDTTFGGTANSILSLQVTDATTADYEAINITDARVLVYPELQLGAASSIKFPDGTVQLTAPGYALTQSSTTPNSVGLNVPELLGAPTTLTGAAAYAVSGYVDLYITGNNATSVNIQFLNTPTVGNAIAVSTSGVYTIIQDTAQRFTFTSIFANVTAPMTYQLSFTMDWNGAAVVSLTDWSAEYFKIGNLYSIL
jgi:hypothetical protein